MQYLGSKRRFARDIFSAIIRDIQGDLFSLTGNPAPKNWVEPFVGVGGMMQAVPSSFRRYGNDANHYLIAMHKAVQKGWEPPKEISEEKCIDIKKGKLRYPQELVGFVGHACSYAGQWFRTYARGRHRNYALNGHNRLMSEAPRLQNVIFTDGCYSKMAIDADSIVYCDPPYQGTRNGYGDIPVDYGKFHEWLRKLRKEGARVYLSEYSLPPALGTVIWEKAAILSVDARRGSGGRTAVERLYRIDA